MEFLIPDKPFEAEILSVTARYLEPELLGTPALALGRVRMEVQHMGGVVKRMLDQIMPAILGGSTTTLKTIRETDDEVDVLYAQILDYMGQLNKGALTDDQTDEFLQLAGALANRKHR